MRCAPTTMLKSLRTQIVAFFALLLTAVLGVVMVVVGHEGQQISRAHNLRELEVAGRVFQRVLTQNQARLLQAAEVLAADYGFRDAVSSDDQPTIRSALGNHGERVGADVMLLIGLDGKVRADTLDRSLPGHALALERVLADAEHAGSAVGFVPLDDRAFQLVIVPVLAPDPIAWVAMGFVIDDALARDLQALTSVQVTFLRQSRAAGWSAFASSQGAAARAALAAAVTRMLGTRAAQALSIVVNDFDSRLIPLGGHSDAPLAVVLQRSLGSSRETFRPLLSSLALLSAAVFCIALVGSIVIASRITRPLDRLASVARRMRDGDYAEPIKVAAIGEVGAFAETFDHMRGAIAARESEIRRLAYEDALTGLPNRPCVIEALTQLTEAGQKTGRRFSVLLLDLDRFREVNDILGHDAGDRVLVIVAQRLRSMIRTSDVVARLGGDEFAIILTTGDSDDVDLVADRIHDALGQPISVADQGIDVSASIGVVRFPAHGVDAGTLLQRGDVAMHSAKRQRIRYASYDSTQDEHRKERLHLLGDLRRAVDDDQLMLLYQPKIQLPDGHVRGVEALLRWSLPGGGMVPPAEFLPFAEQTGAIRLITRWVITRALRQCRQWQDQGYPLHISINVSARDLADPTLPDFIARELAAIRLPAALVCLEITESALMEDAAFARRTLTQLRDLGLSLSIDDYGTGYSSLAYLKELPVDELKIDRAFVKDVALYPEDAAIVRSTIDLGHSLDLTVTAEGVENEHQLELLGRFGCDAAQGYHISCPIDGVSLIAWLATRSVASAPESRLAGVHPFGLRA